MELNVQTKHRDALPAPSVVAGKLLGCAWSLQISARERYGVVLKLQDTSRVAPLRSGKTAEPPEPASSVGKGPISSLLREGREDSTSECGISGEISALSDKRPLSGFPPDSAGCASVVRPEVLPKNTAGGGSPQRAWQPANLSMCSQGVLPTY